MTTDPLGKKLTRRAQESIALANNKVPARLLKSPSQKRSERLDKKYQRRAGLNPGIQTPPKPDCHTCPKYPCGKTLDAGENCCGEGWCIHRCKSCGQKVKYRFDINKPWELCPVCRERR